MNMLYGLQLGVLARFIIQVELFECFGVFCRYPPFGMVKIFIFRTGLIDWWFFLVFSSDPVAKEFS